LEIAFAINKGRLLEPHYTPEARRERRELLETMSAKLGQLVALKVGGAARYPEFR
jgi:hypothetical protein